MRYLYVFILFVFSFSAVAQTASKANNGFVQGTVLDEETKKPVHLATLRILNKTDSAYIAGGATDENGKFKLSIASGEYYLEISFIGYKTVSKEFSISVKTKDYSFGDILLEEGSIELGQAVIEAEIPNIVVKGDTIEYNASSYSSQESDMLEDIVKNIPGIELDENGNITANGKPVTKILVDGKEFFGNDIPLALSNLPANMIKKLQLYKEESETAKVTGFKDKDPQQVLNLVVKEELKQSAFGEVKGGYGSDDKYANRANINYMRNENQMSVIGNMNNVSDGEFGGGGSGINTNKSIGGNTYLKPSEKFNIGGNIRYSNNENSIETLSNTQTFLSTGDRFSKNESTSKGRNENTNFGFNVQWKPDSLTTIYARSSVGLTNGRNESSSSDLSYVAGKDTTAGQSLNINRTDGYNISNSITIGRKLNSKGRTVSLSLNNSFRNNDSKGSNYSITKYSNDTEDKIIDQRSTSDNKSDSYGFSASYVEPLGKDNRLQLRYSLDKNTSDRTRDVRRKDVNGDYTIIDSAYARNTSNDFISQNISLNFQRTKEKYRYTIGFSVDPSYSRSKVSLGDSIIEDLKQNVVNFSPSVNFSYHPNNNTNIDINYSGSTSQPGISQLSADTVIVSALSKHYGNPDLKPSYSNNFHVYYQKSNYETSRFLMIMGSINYTLNNIVNYTLIDDLGNTTTTYRNVNGNMGVNVSVMFDTPLRNKKFSINANLYSNYSKNIGYTNGDKAVTHNVVLVPYISGKFKIEKFETSLRANLSYNMTRNNLTSQSDRNTSNYFFTHMLSWKLPYDFTFSSNLSYSYYSGYGKDFKNSEVLWNIAVSKQFLKKKKGNLRLQVFDILNDRSTIRRTVNSNYISDSRSNTINQYFLVSFTYKFNIIKGKKSKSDNEQNRLNYMY